MAPPGPSGSRRAVAAVTALVVASGAGLVALLLSGAGPYATATAAVLAVVVLVVVLSRVFGHLATISRRLAADTVVIADANPGHRLDPAVAGDLAPLAEAVNRLADLRQSAQRDVQEQAEAARRDADSERNLLAALMAQLTVAVLVCNHEGRILLYNEAARDLLGEASPVGIGRSVFGVVDRGLVTHAQDRLASGAEQVYTASSLHGDRLLRVRVTPVNGPGAGAADSSGFVLVLDDLTRQVRAGDERSRLLRELTEATRATLGSIRAAAESMLDYPTLSGEERQAFLEIVRDEAGRLGDRVEEVAAAAGDVGEDQVLAEIAADDLLALLDAALRREGVPVRAVAAPDLWLRVDGHAVARAVAHLVLRVAAGLDGLSGDHGDPLTLSVEHDRGHARLDIEWAGAAPSPAEVERWLDEPLDPGSTITARQVADRHGGEVWGGERATDAAYLRVLLPVATSGPAVPTPRPRPEVASRPTFYDFDLFTAGPQADRYGERRLDEVAFTVFDTETTGLDPAGGDRVISIGAVRVVNGRVLTQETFEQLVQPGRSVPPASTRIHGITEEMLEGAPPIEDVLPAFARFSEDTVLVGHNVAFDLQFLRMAERASGVRFAQPALDTLFLHAALHPDHPEHTLEAIAERLGVSVVGRHTALGDALVTAEVFVALQSLMRGRGVETVADAVALARQTYQGRR